MEIERTIKYSDGGMATGLVGEDQVKDLSFKIIVKEMPKSDTILLHEVVTIETFDLGDEKNISFEPFHMIFGDSSLAIFDALGVDDVAGLKRSDCVEFLENLKKQGKTERDGSFIAGLCNFSGKNIFMFFNVQRLNFKGFASRVLPHEALHLARLLITLKENKWIKDNLTTPEWYLDPKATFVDMKDDNEEFFAETLERTSAIAMDAWQRITGEKCYMDGGGIEDETKEVSDEHINSIIEDISDYKIYGSAEGDVDAETITFYCDYNEEDKNYNIEIIFKVDDPYADYEYISDDPDETIKISIPSYHLQSIVLIEDDMYNIQLTDSQKEKLKDAIQEQFDTKIAAAYDYALRMDAYESIDPESAGSGVYEPKKYFMKDGGGVDDVKSFVATKEGIIEIYSGSDARSAEVKIGDTFIVTEEMKNGIYYLGKLNIKGSFKLSAGLSGKDVNKMNFGKQDEILYLLRKENIGGDSNFFAQFKNNNKMKNGGDIHDLYQIIIYNRFGDEMHSYIIGDYEKAMENLKEDLKLAETGSRVDISHNGEVIYSETKKQYKNGGGVGNEKTYRVPISKKISQQDVDAFVKYAQSFYGENNKVNNMYGKVSDEEVKKAAYQYIYDLSKLPTWSKDSMDRERVSQYLTKEIKSIFDLMHLYESNDGIKGDDYYYVVDFEKIPQSDVDWFINYVYSFYGRGGVRGSNPYTREQIEKSVYNYLSDLEQFPSWGDGDSIDRERVGQYIEGTTIFTGMYSYKNGGGVGIPNNYESKTKEQVWNNWTKEQRIHFIQDHDTRKVYNAEEEANFDYDDIHDTTISDWLEEHTNRGQYKNGGSVYDDYAENVSNEEIEGFIDYFMEAYNILSNYSIYSKDEDDIGEREEEIIETERNMIRRAILEYFAELQERREENYTWGGGDTLDRERVKIFYDGYFKRYKNGGGVGDEWKAGYILVGKKGTNKEGETFEIAYIHPPYPNKVTLFSTSDKNQKHFDADKKDYKLLFKEKGEFYAKGGGVSEELPKGVKLYEDYKVYDGKAYPDHHYKLEDWKWQQTKIIDTDGGVKDWLPAFYSNSSPYNKKLYSPSLDKLINDKSIRGISDTFDNGGGVGMAMEGMFLDDDFERMVEKLKNYLAKYPYIWTRGTKRYVPIEGWQYAAALMGLSSRVKNVNEVQPGVWQAEADVVDKRSGVVNCSGFAIVNKAEHKWAKKDEDIINFVQTRAVSRALRNCISYLIKAAGYSTTPAEEMYGLASEEKKKKGMPSSIKPVKGVSEDDFIFDRPEYNEGMTQPPFPKEDVPITKYVPREEIPQEDMLRKVWAESKANGIVIRSAEFMNEIELALTDETIGTETQIKSLLMESYNWLTENGIVLRSKIFMKKFKDSL